MAEAKVRPQVQKEEPKKPNDFQRELEKEEETGATVAATDSDDQKDYDLDEQVDVWSDYLRTRFHPRQAFVQLGSSVFKLYSFR